MQWRMIVLLKNVEMHRGNWRCTECGVKVNYPD